MGHRDPNSWDELLIFKPERFENGETKSHKFMPFGLGRRGVQGQVMPSVCWPWPWCFDWKRVGNEEIDMTEGHELTTPKAQPLVAMCRAHPIMNKVLADAI
ncbi:Cytochrome P450 - like 10 [Theobroma cacao]|nr:Cytochrome P450 - like 10 [Theobroma cacao]